MSFALLAEKSSDLAALRRPGSDWEATIPADHANVWDPRSPLPAPLIDAAGRPAVVFLLGSAAFAEGFFTAWAAQTKLDLPWTIALVAADTQPPAVVHDFWNLDEPTIWRERRFTLLRAKSEREKEARTRLAKAETTVKQREEFLSVCAHDLRAPLGLIQTSLSLVQNAAPTKENQALHQELLGRAKRQAGYALALVKDLLDVMSLEQGLKPQYALVKLQDLLDDFTQDYKFQAAQKGIQFHYRNAVPTWKCLADADRVRQLLQNLVTNALKFTEAGKNIYLDVNSFQGRRKSDPPFPMLVLSIRDEGVGIPQTQLQKIFDRFAQIKNTGHAGANADGRGLGLAVAKQISLLHDGNVWVESEEGKGSTFHVLFPHVVSREDLSGPPAVDTVIADPSPQRRREFEKLTVWGQKIEFANDGVEAITKLFYLGAKRLVITPDLAKISAPEVCAILKSDRLGSQIPLLLAGDLSGRPIDQYLVDSTVEVPLTEVGWQKSVKSAEAAVSATRSPAQISQGSSGAKTPRRVKAA